MRYDEFLEKVVSDGIEAARADYVKPEDAERLEGSVAGFESCRGKGPTELLALLEEAGRTLTEKHMEALDEREGPRGYWYWRCRHAEVEWVCNVVGAALGVPVGGVMVTARGMLKAGQVLQREGCLEVEGG